MNIINNSKWIKLLELEYNFIILLSIYIHILGLGNINFSTWFKLGITYFLSVLFYYLLTINNDDPKKCNIATITINFFVYYLLLFLIPNKLHILIANDNI
jgi:hypothetical protein